MKCFACNAEAGNFDGPTGRFYCSECMHIIRMTANAKEDVYENDPGGDHDVLWDQTEDLTINFRSAKLDVEQLKQETGIDVSEDTSDMSALWS